MLRSKLGLAATLTAATLVSGSIAKADTKADRLAALEAEVAKMKAEQVNEAVAQVKTEAAARDSYFLADGGSAGYDNGFYISNADGSFTLKPFAQFQFRYALNSFDGVLDDDANVEDGFEIRRLRIGIKGNIFSKDTTYELRGSANRSGGSFQLDNAYIKHKLNDSTALRVGQWKDQVFLERSISSMSQMAVDRSLNDEVLGGGNLNYVQGVGLVYEEGQIQAQVSLLDGPNSANTPYTNSGSNFAVEGRINYLVSGDFADTRTLTTIGSKGGVLMVGGGFHWAQSGDADVLYHTVDVLYKEGQLALMAAYLGQWIEGDNDSYNAGLVVQAAYAVDQNWEPFARLGVTWLDDDITAGEDNFWEITAGVNYHFNKNAKATVDVGYLINGAPAGSNVSGLNYVAGEEDQLVIRGQFTLGI
jgi:hypothetical protein